MAFASSAARQGRARRALPLTVQDDGEGEQLNDYAFDPWELESKQSNPAYARVKAVLIGALNRLKDCKGRGCEVKVRVPSPG